MKPKRAALALLIGLALYLSLYTWNHRTGALDGLAVYVGLDLAGWFLRPVSFVVDKAQAVSERYVYLVGLKEENDQLRAENERLRQEAAELRELAAESRRLERLLAYSPPPDWRRQGARVVAQRLGPASALESVLLDKGRAAGVEPDTPVTSVDGLVGRVIRAGLFFSQVLLVSDPNSHIAVIGQEHRSQGMVTGQGPGRELLVKYVNINTPLEKGELLVTSGVGGIYPKGLPVARVTNVERSDLSLFLSVTAEALAHFTDLEDVLLLTPSQTPAWPERQTE